MAVKLNKPILVAGIGLSFLLWLWDNVSDEIMEVGEWGLLGAIALGGGFWFLHQKSPKISLSYLSPLKRETVEEAIGQALKIKVDLETEAPLEDISVLKQQIAQLSEGFKRQTLQIAVTGGRKVGKSSLIEVLASEKIAANLSFVETEPLGSETVTTEIAAKQVASSSDLVLFLVNGDLTDSQWRILGEYKQNYQRFLLIFNKQDQYLPEEKALIVQQLKSRVQPLMGEEDVMAISAAPNDVKVRQYQKDGSVQEWMEKQTANLEILESRLSQIIAQEREQLIWGTIWREAMQLKQQGKQKLNGVRRTRAMPVVEQYQWIVAASAFANPVAALDLLATAAINAQMIVDLSKIYQQQFSLSQAQATSGTVGKLMVKLGLVELSTQTLGSLLKSHLVTFVAGGVIQGVSAAYLTRIAGLSLIEYFQEQEVSITSGKVFNLEKFTEKLKQVFDQNQRTAFLQEFVKVALGRLPVVSS
ncbi:slr1306 family protein [Gloeothece verrucosa]|uniref:DUF697 domain-containing protein n=1 Tax=Gloeothece verrucosa (strain PCC 7822) TaxID=497965 RepID=E0U8N5_GLOV7|nr:DUF697 domain-containing protein [Gloeothece verrucosa]ADN13781.1 Protein of unknown function DUF2307, GTPase-associated [Gloeothece verrucosa PCC 7822]